MAVRWRLSLASMLALLGSFLVTVPSARAQGTVTTPVGPGDDEAFAVALQPDGKIVAAGRARKAAPRSTRIARVAGARLPRTAGVVRLDFFTGLVQRVGARLLAAHLHGHASRTQHGIARRGGLGFGQWGVPTPDTRARIEGTGEGTAWRGEKDDSLRTNCRTARRVAAGGALPRGARTCTLPASRCNRKPGVGAHRSAGSA